MWLYELATGRDSPIDTSPVEVAGHFAWSPAGDSVYVAGNHSGIWSIYRVSIDGEFVDRLTPGSEEEYHVSISPDETSLLFARAQDASRIVIVDVHTGESHQPFDLELATRFPRFSEDGTRLLVEDVLRLGEGAVVELDKLAGDPVDIYVNDRHVARGEVLVLNDNFCVRVSEILEGLTDAARAAAGD